MQIYIIPTYECNLDCKSCYAKKNQQRFPQYLSWKDFTTIYEKFKFDSNNFLFIGGEATKWKFINEAILFLKNKDKNITLFSNGIEMINSMPNNIIINGNNLFDNEYSSVILNNIGLYKKKKVNVILRYNISEYFKNHVQDAINFAEKYADSVSLSVLFPVDKSDINIGQLVYQIAKELSLKKIRVKIARATPLCLFSVDQRVYLEENCSLKGRCALPTNSIVINPDGKSVQPCVELSIIKDIDCFSKSSAKILFKNEINSIIKRADNECSNCEMYKNQKCVGGCLSYIDFGVIDKVAIKLIESMSFR